MSDDTLLKDIVTRVTKLDEHVGQIRVDIGQIKRDIEARPTTAELWKVVACGAGAVILAMWGGMLVLMKPWTDRIATIGNPLPPAVAVPATPPAPNPQATPRKGP